MTSTIYYPGYSQVNIVRNLTTLTIASITNANPCIVTTEIAGTYVPGMIASFLIPTQFGMQQLNNLKAQVIDISGTEITLGIDSTNFTPFAYPGSLPSAYTPPSIIPYASGPYLPPWPLPYGNETSFEGVGYNGGEPGDFI